MKRTPTILALLAAVVVTSALASAISVTFTQVRIAGAIVMTLTDSKTDPSHWAKSVAAEAKGGFTLLFCDLPAGFYTAVVLARK